MHITHEDLKSVILNTGLIKEDEFDSAKDEAFRGGQQVVDVLIGRGDISEDYLVDYLSQFFRVPVVDLKKEELKKEIIELIPESYAKVHRVIAFGFDREKNIAKVAMIDPLDLETQEYLKAKFEGAQILPYMMAPSSFKHALKQYKKKIGEEFNKIIEDNIKQSMEAGIGPGTESDLSRMAEAVPIISILDSILEHAASLGASDVHFEPFEDKFILIPSIRYSLRGRKRKDL